MECSQCSAADAGAYEFAFGKRTGSTSYHSGNTRTTITRYQMGGTRQDYFCHKCVSNQRVKMGVGSVIGSIIGCLFFAMMFGVFLTPKRESFNYEPWLWGGIAIGAVVGLVISYVRSDEEVGDTLAVKNNRHKVKSLGWDSLFTREQRKKLK